MPAASAYRRAPLVNPAYVPLSDAALHPEGTMKNRIQQVLNMVSPRHMSTLDSVLATKLGGYAQLPPMPDVEAAAALLPADPSRFVESVWSASMLAAMSRDKEGMLRVLGAMRAFAQALPQLSEEALFACGADALRLTVDLYRRTGQPFLLNLLETMRGQLPDVSGLMHMFPFQREYRRESQGNTPEEKAFYDRMDRFAMGKGAADALAMTVFLGQYSGSGRDAAAPLTGLNALNRYHGMPCGAFAADPYLAGRDPARAVELDALCAQIEAYADALCFTGENAFAERLELIWENALPDLLTEAGLRTLEPTNRLADDESCQLHAAPEKEDVSALLRALYALRRSVWLSRDDSTLTYMLPVESGCITRLGGVPVRMTAAVKGLSRKEITLQAELKQPVQFTLELRVPRWADSATVSVNGGKPVQAQPGEKFPLTRLFQSGDTIVLTLASSPRLETGYRGSLSVFCGSTLMALPLPGAEMEWRYALVSGESVTVSEEDGELNVLVTACEAPLWKEKKGFILPPPQNCQMGPAYRLTLIPYAGCGGRIAAFPCVRA